MKTTRVFLIAVLLIALFVAAIPAAFADGPTSSPGAAVASPSGQNHGAFNFQNTVYGTEGTPGGVSNSSNSSSYGTGGGSPGAHDGAVGQEPGATGFNNSNTAPWGPP